MPMASRVNVRFTLKADITYRDSDVRFVPTRDSLACLAAII